MFRRSIISSSVKTTYTRLAPPLKKSIVQLYPHLKKSIQLVQQEVLGYCPPSVDNIRTGYQQSKKQLKAVYLNQYYDGHPSINPSVRRVRFLDSVFYNHYMSNYLTWKYLTAFVHRLFQVGKMITKKGESKNFSLCDETGKALQKKVPERKEKRKEEESKFYFLPRLLSNQSLFYANVLAIVRHIKWSRRNYMLDENFDLLMSM